jgi:hypothetical protein
VISAAFDYDMLFKTLSTPSGVFAVFLTAAGYLLPASPLLSNPAAAFAFRLAFDQRSL